MQKKKASTKVQTTNKPPVLEPQPSLVKLDYLGSESRPYSFESFLVGSIVKSGLRTTGLEKEYCSLNIVTDDRDIKEEGTDLRTHP